MESVREESGSLHLNGNQRRGVAEMASPILNCGVFKITENKRLKPLVEYPGRRSTISPSAWSEGAFTKVDKNERKSGNLASFNLIFSADVNKEVSIDRLHDFLEDVSKAFMEKAELMEHATNEDGRLDDDKFLPAIVDLVQRFENQDVIVDVPQETTRRGFVMRCCLWTSIAFRAVLIIAAILSLLLNAFFFGYFYQFFHYCTVDCKYENFLLNIFDLTNLNVSHKSN